MDLNQNPELKRKITGQKPQTATELLGKYRWITQGEAELHYISTALGNMEKEGFKFYYADPWSEWPESYLESVLAHHFSLLFLRNEQYELSKGKKRNQMPAMPQKATEANMAREREFQEKWAARMLKGGFPGER